MKDERTQRSMPMCQILYSFARFEASREMVAP